MTNKSNEIADKLREKGSELFGKGKLYEALVSLIFK